MALFAVKLADHIAVPIQPQPCQPAQDRGGGFGGGAFAVGIFDPQQELTAPPARVKQVEQRRPAAADVQIARGRRRKAGDDLGRGHMRVNLLETLES